MPLVLADLKAPVQCSPCKKIQKKYIKNNTIPVSLHCPPHRRGSHSVCVVRICFGLLNQMGGSSE